MNFSLPPTIWYRFLVAGRRIERGAPGLLPLVVELLEDLAVAVPETLTTDDLLALSLEARRHE
ncbi:MAG: hypothetical protein MJE77_33340 [Proteobacteria bacterium]|nr:hypothetical protein [Pseudomonadota bacterium]